MNLVSKHVRAINIDDINKLNADFASNSYACDNEIDCDYQIRDNECNTSFKFVCVSQLDVLESFLSIKSNAVGLDKLHPTFIKSLLPVMLPFFTHVFNTILTTSAYPPSWKKAKIIPIPKVIMNTDPSLSYLFI